MSGMAEVLMAHWSRSTHSDSEPYVDKCDGCGAVIYTWGDEPTPGGIEPLAAHQAAALTAAGFGPGAEAKADALEEAAEVLEEDASRSSYTDPEEVTQGQLDAAEWLRARAADLRTP